MKTNKTMTAVEWLFEQIEGEGDIQRDVLSNVLEIKISVSNFLEIKRLAKEMEKQQIVNTYIIADSESTQEDSEHNALKFYERTYGSKGSELEQINQDNPVTRGSTTLVPISSKTEISDEEIYNEADYHFRYFEQSKKDIWINACKWYREQLKQKRL